MAYIPSSEEERQFLAAYDPKQYEQPAVAADTAVFAVDGNIIKLLLIRRGGFPYKGCWALPGGFVNIDEDIANGALRELEEESSISDLYIEQAFVWGKPDRDPRSRMITVSYITLADFASLHPIAGDDADQAEWFTITDYQKTQQGNETHISYTLSGTQTLKPQVKYPKGKIQQITPVSCGGLAFDHAESIAYSFELLKKRVSESDFALFALGDMDKAAHAKEVIGRY